MRSSVKSAPLNLPLASKAMAAVMSAQFLSALADNALLIACIALVKAAGLPHQVPWLQEAFIVPFIVLAPFAGPLADSFPKGRVMLASNALKLIGAGAILLGFNPLLGYAVVGIGATLYSPAKYGILAQMFAPEKLVRANGMFEGSTIAAILLGVVAGGYLAQISVTLALITVVVLYLLAAGANLLIPRLPPEHPAALSRPSVFVRDFGHACATLTADRDARFSTLGSSLFWGAGSALRLALFAWVPAALGIVDIQTPSNLMGALSVGIVAGAVIAGVGISLKTVNRALIGGLLLGPLIVILAYVGNFYIAAVLLILVGAAGGVFAVPLNALLQERGHLSVGAGRALAVQNLVENLSILLFVGFYAGMEKTGVPPAPTVALLGGVLLAGLSALTAWRLLRR